jgi:LPXTG-motif cell wall-anchored protein
METKTYTNRTRAPRKLLLILLALSMTLTLAFPLSAFAEEEALETSEPTLIEDGAAVPDGANEIVDSNVSDGADEAVESDVATDEAVDSNVSDSANEVLDSNAATDEAVELETKADSEPSDLDALGGAFGTPYTSPDSFASDITSFAIAGNPNLTGHLRIGRPGTTQSPTLGRASYYLTYDDGVNPATEITYAFSHNSFGYAYFDLLVETGAGYDVVPLHNISVDSISLDTSVAGYTAVQLKGDYSSSSYSFDVTVTLTPHADGAVYHEWNVVNTGSSSLTLGAGFTIDTMLGDNDYVPVYSLGSGLGMYIDDASAFARVTFPAVPVANGGPIDASAAKFGQRSNAIFGSNYDSNINPVVSHATGDVLLQGVDSGVYWLYAFDTLAPAANRSFVYAVALGEAVPIIPIVPVNPIIAPANPVIPPVEPVITPPEIPATGDSIISFLLVVVLLGIGAGALILARYRQRKQKIQ